MWFDIRVSILLVVILASPSLQGRRSKRQGYNSESCITPRNIDGVCINIKDCPEHLDYLLNRRTEPDIVEYLRRAVCRREGSQIITCCPVKKNVNFGSDKSCTTPRNLPGQCINIKSCPVLLDMLQKRTEPGWREYLVKSQCGPRENNVVKVCCPSSSNNNQALDVLPDNGVCGRSDATSNRVVNGRPAVLGSWPWMAALGYRTASKPLDWLCGGSLISSRHVLTAAHCLVNIGSRRLTVVRLGDLNLDDSVQDRATPIDVPVEKTIVHENYDAAAHTVDIALVRLKDRVEFTKLIRPICIPPQSLFKGNMMGYSPFVIGWGAIGYKGPSTTALQEAQIDITDQDFCSNAYKNIKGATIDDRVICALSDTGKDACQGDSGGPLILPKDSNFYLIGLVSYGYKCAEPGYPGVYTKVSLYNDWIKKTIRA